MQKFEPSREHRLKHYRLGYQDLLISDLTIAFVLAAEKISQSEQFKPFKNQEVKSDKATREVELKKCSRAKAQKRSSKNFA